MHTKVVTLLAVLAATLSLAAPASADSHRNQRDRHERTVRETVGSSIRVTRRDNGNGPVSRSHGDGRAFDYVSNARTGAERRAEAERVSGRLPRNTTTIVETPVRRGFGPADSHDIHDYYKNGRYVGSRYQLPRATGPHTHVQIDPPRRGARAAR